MIESHIEHLLPDYLENQLSDLQLDEVEAHLSDCQSCRESLTWLMDLESVWEEGPYLEPSVNFADGVMQRIDQLEAEHLDSDTQERTRGQTHIPVWKRSDIRNMVAAVAASFVLWQGVSGIVMNVGSLDESAHGYTSVLKTTLQDYLNAATYWLKK